MNTALLLVLSTWLPAAEPAMIAAPAAAPAPIAAPAVAESSGSCGCAASGCENSCCENSCCERSHPFREWLRSLFQSDCCESSCSSGCCGASGCGASIGGEEKILPAPDKLGAPKTDEPTKRMPSDGEPSAAETTVSPYWPSNAVSAAIPMKSNVAPGVATLTPYSNFVITSASMQK